MTDDLDTEDMISLTAWWGNDDVCATIQISQSDWESIQNGEYYEEDCSYFYEGEEYAVTWVFSNAEVSIHGDNGMECVCDLPIDSLQCERG